MLSTIPPIFSSTTPTSNATPAATTTDNPNTLNMIQDPKMISFLSSPSVMNGSVSKGRQSVWSVLDRLKGRMPAPLDGGPADASMPAAHSPEVGKEGLVDEEQDDDDSSIMLYGPLLPDADSEVELAQSEVVHGDEKGEETDDGEKAKKDKSPSIWPFTGRKSKSEGEKNDGRVHLHGSKDKRVWVPSDTKISLQIMWWGYRL